MEHVMIYGNGTCDDFMGNGTCGDFMGNKTCDDLGEWNIVAQFEYGTHSARGGGDIVVGGCNAWTN